MVSQKRQNSYLGPSIFVAGRCAVQDKLGPVRMVWGTGFLGGLPDFDLDDGVGAFAAWKTAPLSRGEGRSAVVTAPKSKIGSLNGFSSFRREVMHLLPSLVTWVCLKMLG